LAAISEVDSYDVIVSGNNDGIVDEVIIFGEGRREL
jgi:hypothetical protein